MTFEAERDRGSPWSGEHAARRLFVAVRGACAEVDGLPARLAVGLRGALEILAEEPELAYLLTVEPYLGDGRALDSQRRWIARYGELLRDAVAEDPRTTNSDLPFLAGFLIGGVRFQIARLVLRGEGPDLLRLLPGLVEGLLSYYFEPGEPRRLARAALDG